MKVRELLIEGTERLSAAGIEEARREAGSLMTFATGRSRTFLITEPEAELTAEEEATFRDALAKREARIPFQHITGVQEFFGLDFRVTPDVLIPRPETEFAVEAAISQLRGIEHASFAEVGVGSGCISVSILHNVPGASCVGLEISEAAIAVATENALRHGVFSHLDLRLSDVYSALGSEERFDLIVSNPPYIPLSDMDSLQAEVKDHDPRLALTDESDGLRIIERIIEGAPAHLKPQGCLIIEIGYGQSTAVAAMFDRTVWASHEFILDLQSIPRTVVARTV